MCACRAPAFYAAVFEPGSRRRLGSRTRCLAAATLALTLCAATGRAHATSSYNLTTLVFFGDSLTDEGRNGRTAPTMWSEVLRNDLSITSGTNYAIGGAITSNQPTTAFGDASYLGQINSFVSAGGATNSTTGAGVWIGTNNIWQGASNHLSATAVATSAANDVQTGITQLRAAGVSTIILLGVYDLSLTNAYKSAGTDSAAVRSSAAISSQAYNTLLQQISTTNTNVVYFNIANFINFLQQNASAYGFTRVLPLLSGQSCDATCQQTSIFSDTIHLTSRAQQLIGDYVASGNPIYNSANFTYGAIASNVISAEASVPMQSYLARSAAADLIRWNFTRLDRLSEEDDQRRSLWSIFGAMNASSDTVKNSGLSINGTQSIVGLTSGVDFQASQAVHVGSLVNYAHSEADLRSSVSSLTKLDAFQFAGYATVSTPYGYVHALAGAGYDSLWQERRGSFGQISSSPSGTSYFAAVQTGRLFDFDMIRVGPLAGLSYIVSNVGSYTETGSTYANMTVGSQASRSLNGSVGIEMRPGKGFGWAFDPSLTVSYEHEFLKSGQTVSTGFAYLPTQTLPVSTITGTNAVRADFGLNYAIKDGFDIAVDANGVLAQSGNRSIGGSLRGNYRF